MAKLILIVLVVAALVFVGQASGHFPHSAEIAHVVYAATAATAPFAPVYLSVSDTCTRYNCSRTQLYRLLGDGEIKAKKHGQRLLVDVASADAYFAALPDARIKADKHQGKRQRAAAN